MVLKHTVTAALIFLATMIMIEEGLCVGAETSSVGTEDTIVAVSLDKKYWINDRYYFTCSFDKKPRIGTAVLKIQIFTKDGGRDTSFLLKGESDMPGMRGAHHTGPQPFKLNNKGDYLLPIDVVMPGDWEIILTFKDGDRIIFRGRILFRV